MGIFDMYRFAGSLFFLKKKTQLKTNILNAYNFCVNFAHNNPYWGALILIISQTHLKIC